jgi:signal peptidase I
VTLLAAIASLLFPGSGQALTGRWRPAVIWAGASLVPVLAMFVWVPLVHLSWMVRLAAAVDAGIRVRRAAPGTKHLGLAGMVAVGLTAALTGAHVLVFEPFRSPASSMAPALEIGDHFFVNKLATPERGDIVVFWHPVGRQYVKRLIAVGGDVVAVREGVLYLNGTATPRREIGATEYRDYDEVSDSWSIKPAHAFEERLGGHTYRVYLAPRRPDDTGEWFHDFPRTDDAFFAEDRDPCGRRPMLDEPAGPDTRPQMRLSRDGQGCVVPAGTLFFLGDNRDNSNDSRAWGVIRAKDAIGVVAGIWWPLSRLGDVE